LAKIREIRVKKHFPVGLRCGAALTSGGAAAPPYLMDSKLILEAARGTLDGIFAKLPIPSVLRIRLCANIFL
jgi:hypothetical protein